VHLFRQALYSRQSNGIKRPDITRQFTPVFDLGGYISAFFNIKGNLYEILNPLISVAFY